MYFSFFLLVVVQLEIASLYVVFFLELAVGMFEQSNLDFLMYGAQTGNISQIFYTALNLINFVSEII